MFSRSNRGHPKVMGTDTYILGHFMPWSPLPLTSHATNSFLPHQDTINLPLLPYCVFRMHKRAHCFTKKPFSNEANTEPCGTSKIQHDLGRNGILFNKGCWKMPDFLVKGPKGPNNPVLVSSTVLLCFLKLSHLTIWKSDKGGSLIQHSCP